MRRISLGTVLVLAALGAGAPGAGAQAPAQDSVTGSVTVPFFNRVTVDAHSGPSGESPTGRADFEGGGDFTFGGPITCLGVRGNVAVFSIDTIFGVVTAEVTDNAASGAPDVIRSPGGNRAPDDCSPFKPGEGIVVDPATSGDLRVVDAQPTPAMPTSVRQCLRGGYTQFGFATVGRCVVFVVKARVCKLLERFGHAPRFCPPALVRP